MKRTTENTIVIFALIVRLGGAGVNGAAYSFRYWPDTRVTLRAPNSVQLSTGDSSGIDSFISCSSIIDKL